MGEAERRREAEAVLQRAIQHAKSITRTLINEGVEGFDLLSLLLVAYGYAITEGTTAFAFVELARRVPHLAERRIEALPPDVPHVAEGRLKHAVRLASAYLAELLTPGMSGVTIICNHGDGGGEGDYMSFGSSMPQQTLIRVLRDLANKLERSVS